MNRIVRGFAFRLSGLRSLGFEGRRALTIGAMPVSSPFAGLELALKPTQQVGISLLANIKNIAESVFDYSVWFISTIKRRKAKMNKHKLRKRRKKMRKNTKVSRG